MVSRSRRVVLTRESARFSVVYNYRPELTKTCSRARVVKRSFGKVVDVGNWEKSSGKSARVCRSVDDTVVSVLLEGPVVAAASLVVWLISLLLLSRVVKLKKKRIRISPRTTRSILIFVTLIYNRHRDAVSRKAITDGKVHKARVRKLASFVRFFFLFSHCPFYYHFTSKTRLTGESA